MTLEALDSITVRLGGKSHNLEPGETIELPTEKAQLLLARAPGKVRVCLPMLQPGGMITWQRAGKAQQGVVDILHVDGEGQTWAFVTIGESWAAINLMSTDVTTPSEGEV